ncbi:hypothetical protein VE02_02786 [Pseudogymnoascus sp. 03VT05]|nr:hypothetical protein VE02_02786 [Pseudogymnoascus sp. 03VT05]
MEIGLVIGIVSLYSTCQSCYNLYSETKDSTTNVTLAAHQLYIHRSIFKAWAFYWEIKLHDPNSPTAGESGDDQELANIKLRRYLGGNPYKAKGIASALYCIEVDLDDIQIPVEKEHTALSPSAWNNLKTNVIQKTKTISSRFTPTRKLTWVLKDSGKSNVLIENLKKHNDSLHPLCPEFAFELLLINVALDYLPRHEGLELKQLQQLCSSSEVKLPDAASGSVRGGGETNADAVIEAGAIATGDEIGEILPLVSPSQHGLQVVIDLANIKI